MVAVASETFTSASAPIQYAAVRAYQGGTEIEQYLWQSRRILRTLGRYIARRLKECGARVSEPQGAFYLFPDFSPFRERLRNRGVITSEDFCRCLLEETGVAVLPGSVFGRPPEELTVRMAYVDFHGTRALRAVEQLPENRSLNENFLKQYCGNVVTAIDNLCKWLQE
jgi:aspartate aminotransferase